MYGSSWDSLTKHLVVSVYNILDILTEFIAVAHNCCCKSMCVHDIVILVGKTQHKQFDVNWKNHVEEG